MSRRAIAAAWTWSTRRRAWNALSRVSGRRAAAGTTDFPTSSDARASHSHRAGVVALRLSA